MCEVIDRARRTGEVEDVIDWPSISIGSETLCSTNWNRALLEQHGNVAASTRQQIVDANDFVAVIEKSFTEMRSDKPCSAGDDRSQ